MKKRASGFTLIEMLAVIAILAILAAILFPVFRSAREAAHKAVCLQNFKSVQFASKLYYADYDDFAFAANNKPNPPRNSQNDRTWVQLLLPYTRTLSVFRCPGDFANRPRTEATFDEDLVPGDTVTRFYSASLRSNIGYNFMYFAPPVSTGSGYTPQPRSASAVSNPSQTIVFLDSVWARDASGKPHGGGSWVVVPPCRYGDSQNDSFKQSSEEVYTAGFTGWDVQGLSGPKYGNAWPWHAERVTVGRFDGGAQTIHKNRLAEGCDALDRWSGRIRDTEKYWWDLN